MSTTDGYSRVSSLHLAMLRRHACDAKGGGSWGARVSQKHGSLHAERYGSRERCKAHARAREAQVLSRYARGEQKGAFVWLVGANKRGVARVMLGGTDGVSTQSVLRYISHES